MKPIFKIIFILFFITVGASIIVLTTDNEQIRIVLALPTAGLLLGTMGLAIYTLCRKKYWQEGKPTGVN